MALSFRRSAFVVLCLITLMIPFEYVLSIEEMMSGIFVLSAAALALCIAAVMYGGPRRNISLTLILLGMFIAWCCCSFFWTADPRQTLSVVQTYFFLLLFVWMIREVTSRDFELRWLMRAYYGVI